MQRQSLTSRVQYRKQTSKKKKKSFRKCHHYHKNLQNFISTVHRRSIPQMQFATRKDMISKPHNFWLGCKTGQPKPKSSKRRYYLFGIRSNRHFFFFLKREIGTPRLSIILFFSFLIIKWFEKMVVMKYKLKRKTKQQQLISLHTSAATLDKPRETLRLSAANW